MKSIVKSRIYIVSENLKAMIMAAGVGSRLDPLTQYIPKPLVPIANKPVMDILFEKLYSIGVKDIISNTYYLSDKIIDRYQENNLGINFNYIKEDSLSGTAGGLKKCQFFFKEGETFLVLSADGLSNADLEKGIEIHKKSNAIATIGIKQIPIEEVSHFGVVVTDDEGFITEFQEKPSVEAAKSNFINTGIYIFDYKIFEYIPENTFCDFAKNVFPQLLAKRAINTFNISEYWSDIGTLEQYKISTQDVFNNLCHFEHSDIKKSLHGAYITGNSKIDPSVQFIGNSTIGNGCNIGRNVIIENSIIWDNVIIEDNVSIKDTVVASGCTIGVNLTSQIIGANQSLHKEKTKIWDIYSKFH